MRERAALLGGEVRLRGEPGKGTTVSVRIPRPRKKPAHKKLDLDENTYHNDHAVVRQGLKLILADHFRKAVFGEARNATEALNCIMKENWDVMILDVTMPGRSGLETLREAKRLRPKLPVVILSMHPEVNSPYGCLNPARPAT